MYSLTGPQLLTYGDVAALLAELLAHPVTFAPRSSVEDERAMVAAGVPQPVAAQNAQASGPIAEGGAEWLSGDSTNLLGRPARSFRDFIADYRAAFVGPAEG